jgi:hypothetical protein
MKHSSTEVVELPCLNEGLEIGGSNGGSRPAVFISSCRGDFYSIFDAAVTSLGPIACALRTGGPVRI